MKFLNVPISVEARKGVPRRIRWGRRTYIVRRLLDFWILQSRWWAREEKRVYFRLETDQGVMEVYRGEGEDGGSGDGGSEDGPDLRASISSLRSDSGSAASNSYRDPRSEERGASKQRKTSGGHPPFVEGDTHTRELRQTESPYRPDAAALAGRRFSETDGSDSGSKPISAQELQTSEEARHRGSASSSGSSRETGWKWVLSKMID